MSDEKAFATLELSEAPSRKRFWLFNLLNVITGSAPDAPEVDVRVAFRDTGRVVYSMTLTSGVALDEGRRMLDQDLHSLTLRKFNEKYGIDETR